jgi:Tetratricopeptide repeat
MFVRAIEIDPKLALLYFNRGVTRKALGEKK